MTTGRLVSQKHFLHIFAAIKISPVKVYGLTNMWAIKNKSNSGEQWGWRSNVVLFEGVESLRCMEGKYGLLEMFTALTMQPKRTYCT